MSDALQGRPHGAGVPQQLRRPYAGGERVKLTPPIPSSRSAGSTGSTRLLWVAIVSALFIFSALGAYMVRTQGQDAAASEHPSTTAASPANPQPSPKDSPTASEPAATAAKSRVIAARAADGIWADLKPEHQANLCKAYDEYPKEAIRGAFLKMATSERATFTAKGATPVQVWNALEQQYLKSC